MCRMYENVNYINPQHFQLSANSNFCPKLVFFVEHERLGNIWVTKIYIYNVLVFRQS